MHNKNHSRNDSNVTNLQLLNSFAVGDEDSSIDFEELRQRYKDKKTTISNQRENRRVDESYVDFKGVDLYESINPIDSYIIKEATTKESSH